jgi:hypothetical protein
MTIFRKDKNLDSPIATFPIAIGFKTDNHDPVEEIVGCDIEDMVKSKLQAFIRSDNGIPEEITFSAAMFVSLGDQSEQRSGNKLMAGNSRAHTRWRIAGDHVKLRHVLPACKKCMGAMEYAIAGGGNDWMQTSRECHNCTNWMLTGTNSPLLAYTPGSTFPKGYLLGGQWVGSTGKQIDPLELT